MRIRGQVEELQKRGHSVLITTYPSGKDVPGLNIVRPPIPARQLQVGSSWQKILLDIAMAPMVLYHALRFKPDVIHAYLHEGVSLGMPAAKLLEIPIVFDFQGSLTAEMVEHGFLNRESPLFPFWLHLENRLDQIPHIVLTSSDHARDLLTRQFGLRQGIIRTVHDSVGPEKFHPPSDDERLRLKRLRKRLGIPAKRKVVVYLGLLAPYQGVDILLEAAREMTAATSAETPHFLVMGFPSVERYRRRAADMEIEGSVTFTGRVPYDVAPDYLALGDVAVAPKLPTTEGSGKLCPYMSVGLPVVATDIPAHREYLEDLGVYVPPGDPQALASALRRLLDDAGERRRIGSALRARALKQFTWARAGDEIERAYGETLDRYVFSRRI